ncbi:MAG: GNAT family N-acetyltransferase [Trebonia sp.]|uniref:GNAT family N-acetyltransferase n=1 Tax=Trebonia sp. TaxID=2767075 RepID=UPI003C736E85
MSAVDVSPTSVAAGTCSVRRAAAADRSALERMLARCTGQTRYRRFHGPVTAFPERYLTEALSGSPLHFALVACLDEDAERGGTVVDGTVVDGTVVDGTIVALASCRAVDEGVAELGILVEDEWQRRGVGGDLLGEIAAYAARTGLRALQAQVLAEQPWIVGLLRRHGTCRVAGAGPALHVTLTLPR